MVNLTLKKPPVSASAYDWQLGAQWSIDGEGTLTCSASGSIALPLPVPGLYRVMMDGTATGLTVNGVPATLAGRLVLGFENLAAVPALVIAATGASIDSIRVEHWDSEFRVEGAEGASMVYQGQDARDPSKRKAPATRNVRVFPTKNNLRALGELFELNHEGDFDPRKRAACTLEAQGLTVIDGYAQVVKVNHSGWMRIESVELQVFGELSDLFARLGGKLVSDLSFSEYTHELLPNPVLNAGWVENPNDHFVRKDGANVQNYAHLSIGAGTVSVTPGAPVSGTKYFRIVTAAPHNLVRGDFVWIQKPGAAVGDHRKHTGEHRVKEVVDANSFVIATSTDGGGAQVNTIRGTGVLVWKRRSLGFGYVYVPADAGLDADVILNNSPEQWHNYPAQTAAQNTYQFTFSRMRPAFYLKELIEKAAKSVGYTVQSSLFDSEDFRRLVVLPWHKENVERDAYSRNLGDGAPNPNYEAYGSSIDPTEFLPQVKVTDLIGDVIKMFNLQIHSVGSVAYLEPRDTFYSDKHWDWNDKVEERELTVTMLPELSARNFELSAAKASDQLGQAFAEEALREFGSVTFESVNEFSTATSKTSLAVVEAAMTVSSPMTINGVGSKRRNFYTVTTKSSDGKPLRKGVRIAYVSSKGVAGYSGFGAIFGSPFQNLPIRLLNNWPAEDPSIASAVVSQPYIYPAASHVDSPSWPMFDINFLTNPNTFPPQAFGEISDTGVAEGIGEVFTTKGLFDRFHERYINSITSKRARMLSGKAQLTPADVAGLDPRTLISLRGQVWILTKLDVDLDTMIGKFDLTLALDLGSTSLSEPFPVGGGKPSFDDLISLPDFPVIIDPPPSDPIVPNKPAVSIKGDITAVTVARPKKPLQHFRVISEKDFTLVADTGSTINGTTSAKRRQGVTDLWSEDGVNWKTVETNTFDFSILFSQVAPARVVLPHAFRVTDIDDDSGVLSSTELDGAPYTIGDLVPAGGVLRVDVKGTGWINLKCER